MQSLFNVNTANFSPSKVHELRLIKVRNLNIVFYKKHKKVQVTCRVLVGSVCPIRDP